jgi:hypothetical protein
MKLFISWSGSVSQQIAQEVRDWFPLILPAVQPFITTTDIDKGARWQGEISKELDNSSYGIVCLTADNVKSQWLAFEAGALSKHLVGRVATVLFGIGHAQVPPPLSMFQGTLFNETDFRQLVSNVNAAVPTEQRREDDQLDVLFPMLWTRLHNPVDLILQNAAAAAPGGEPGLPESNTIPLEMMALLRQQSAVLSSPETFLAPVLKLLEEKLSSGLQSNMGEFRIIPSKGNWILGTPSLKVSKKSKAVDGEKVKNDEQLPAHLESEDEG